MDTKARLAIAALLAGLFCCEGRCAKEGESGARAASDECPPPIGPELEPSDLLADFAVEPGLQVKDEFMLGLPRSRSLEDTRKAIDAFRPLLARYGASIVHEYPGLDAVLVRSEGRPLLEVARAVAACRGAVRYLAPNRIGRLEQGGAPDPEWENQHSLQKIRIDDAWQHSKGDPGVLVAVIDSGIDVQHPDLHRNLWSSAPHQDPAACPAGDHGWDYLEPGTLPDDDYGHGTEVAGVIGAAHDDGCIAGINARVSLVALRISNDGNFETDHLVQALQQAVAMSVDVVNASLSDLRHPTLTDAVSQAQEEGVLIVAAAPANPQHDVDLNPADPCALTHPNVICVTATDLLDAVLPEASIGTNSVDLGAPAEGVVTTSRDGGCSAGKQSSSIATPHVTGVVALLRAKCPGIAAATIKDRILSLGTPAQDLQGRTVSGRRLDAGAALTPPCVGLVAPAPPVLLE